MDGKMEILQKLAK